MPPIFAFRRIQRGLRRALACAFPFVLASAVLAQGRTVLPVPPAPQAYTIPAVFLSDLHFDPFHDPAKVPQLAAAPLAQWPAILQAPESPTREADRAAMQKTCKAKDREDSSYALLHSALAAAKAQSHGARFVAVSGDLLVHDLDCRYRVAMKLPKDENDDQSVSAAFAEKTAVFVMQQVESTFAGTPVYLALGNNDSRCNHNRIDVGDPFLAATGPAVIDGLVGISAKERKEALATFQSAGYYAVTMPAPMQRTRLLVLNDVYMMAKFSTCKADESDHAGADAQITWLTQQLESAHRAGQRVWILSHLPPAVNALSSMKKGVNSCPAEVITYLSSDALAATLTAHANVVKLALFGHTHMDELRLLGSAESGVPVKFIPSVSPVDGNTSSFTVAKVAPNSSSLIDYTVYKASNLTGIHTTWPREYSFDETYHEPAFAPRPLANLIGRLRLDPTASGPDSQAYESHMIKDSEVSDLRKLWPAYTCSLNNSTAAQFKACACAQ